MSAARTVLITGANRGLGLGLCKVFQAQGWRIFPLVRRADVVSELRTELGPSFVPIVADIATPSASDSIREVLGSNTDSLDLIINNAGIPSEGLSIDSLDVEDIDKMFRVHCLGAVRTVQAALPFLRRSGKPIVLNITSRFGSLNFVRSNPLAKAGRVSYAYRIAKAAQNMFSVCLNDELGEHGVIVLSIHPGRIVTSPNMYVPGANMTPQSAAQRIHDWLEGVTTTNTGTFVEPFGETYPW